MKKVYQTIVDKGHGNCMQAAIASLLDFDLDQVPNFIKFKEESSYRMNQFMKMFDYEMTFYDNRNIHPFPDGRNCPSLEEVAKIDGGVNGLFYASVKSQSFKDVMHAVIVDMDMNIIHDPNPNQLALKLSPSDVEQIICVRDGWHINLDGKIIVA